MGLKFGLYVSYTQWKAYHTRLKISPYGGSLICLFLWIYCEMGSSHKKLIPILNSKLIIWNCEKKNELEVFLQTP
jgi:hypothetical protein